MVLLWRGKYARRMADVFDVVADSTRRDIVRLLRQAPSPGEMSVGQLVEALGITQPTVSKHLKVLREGGLVAVREDGQHRYYHFDPTALADLYSWMSAVGDAPKESEPQPFFVSHDGGAGHRRDYSGCGELGLFPYFSTSSVTLYTQRSCA